MPTLNRETIKANGWALGRVFTAGSAPTLVNLIPDKHKDDDSIYVAVTHDCSIINPCLSSEPYVEYLSARPIASENGHFVNARNIRRLHFQIEVNGSPTWYEASMSFRGFIDRQSIETCAPDEDYTLTNQSCLVLKRWLSNRYVSQTFPDRFNDLTSHLVANSKAPLIKAFNTEIGKACHSIFISLTPDDQDLPPEESYELTVLLLFREDIAIDIGRPALAEFGDRIKETLSSTRGLEPINVFALTDADATYAQIVKMTRWQLDYVSLKDDSEVIAVEHS